MRTSSGSSDDENYATLYDLVDDGGSTDLSQLAQWQSFVAAQVDEKGARLQLPRSGASLLVPEGVLDSPRTLFLAVSDHVVDRPRLPRKNKK